MSNEEPRTIFFTAGGWDWAWEEGADEMTGSFEDRYGGEHERTMLTDGLTFDVEYVVEETNEMLFMEKWYGDDDH